MIHLLLRVDFFWGVVSRELGVGSREWLLKGWQPFRRKAQGGRG